MSNHFRGAMLKFPGDDARLDLTDLLVFASPQSPGKTVLILDANPFMTGADFHPEAVYRINVDNDGDTHADAAFSFVFSESSGGSQTGTVYYATGSLAREAEPVGEALIEGTPVGFDPMAKPVQAGACRLFIGVRRRHVRRVAQTPIRGPGPSISPGTSSPMLRTFLRVCAPRRHARAGRSRRQPVVQPVLRRRPQERLQRRTAGRRRGGLPGAVVAATRESRLPARRGQRHGPHRASRRPAVRSQPADALPQRPDSHRRRVRRAEGVLEPTDA